MVALLSFRFQYEHFVNKYFFLLWMDLRVYSVEREPEPPLLASVAAPRDRPLPGHGLQLRHQLTLPRTRAAAPSIRHER